MTHSGAILQRVFTPLRFRECPFYQSFQSPYSRKRALTYLYLFNNKIWIKLNNCLFGFVWWYFGYRVKIFIRKFWSPTELKHKNVRLVPFKISKKYQIIAISNFSRLYHIFLLYLGRVRKKFRAYRQIAHLLRKLPANNNFLVLENSKKLTNDLSAHICHIFIFSFKSLKYSVHLDKFYELFAFILHNFSFNHFLEIVEIHEKSFLEIGR